MYKVIGVVFCVIFTLFVTCFNVSSATYNDIQIDTTEYDYTIEEGVVSISCTLPNVLVLDGNNRFTDGYPDDKIILSFSYESQSDSQEEDAFIYMNTNVFDDYKTVCPDDFVLSFGDYPNDQVFPMERYSNLPGEFICKLTSKNLLEFLKTLKKTKDSIVPVRLISSCYESTTYYLNTDKLNF